MRSYTATIVVWLELEHSKVWLKAECDGSNDRTVFMTDVEPDYDLHVIPPTVIIDAYMIAIKRPQAESYDIVHVEVDGL